MGFIVAILTSQPCIEAVEDGFSGHVSIRLHPFLAPLTSTRHLLACRTAFHPRHSLSVFFPAPFKAQKSAPARHARMNATASQAAGLLR
jgi:hypothetical protein